MSVTSAHPSALFLARLKETKRLPAGMSQSDCRVCKQTSRSSRGTRVRESACTKRFDGSAVKIYKTLFSQSPPPLRGSVSLRLGHGAALTTHRVVIHYRAVTSLPLGGSLGRDHRRAFVCCRYNKIISNRVGSLHEAPEKEKRKQTCDKG